MRILITGGAGFIGSHVAQHMRDQGHDVHIVDRFSYAGKVKNLVGLMADVKVWVGDLKNPEFCDKLTRVPFEGVVHMAGNTHVDRSIADPLTFTMDNVVGTNNLLHALIQGRNQGIPPAKIIVYSTDEVYGSTPDGERFDENQPFNPSNAYSASKVGVEAVARSYINTFQAPIIIVRPCNTYGTRQHPEKAIPRFTRQALRGEHLTVHNDGTGARDWLHTSDHAKAISTLLEKGETMTSYNLAAADEHTDIEVASAICDVLGVDPKIKFVPGRPGHDRRYWMDPAKINALGWKPEVTFEDGLKSTVEWSRDNEDYWDNDFVLARQMVA